MDVYIEYVLIDNLVINYVLLQTTALSTVSKAKKWQLWVSSLIGTVGAIALPFFSGPAILAFFLKLILGLTMVLLISIGENFLKILINFLIFLAYTFVLGGACIGFLSLTQANIFDFVTLSYTGAFPIGVIVLSVFLFTRFVHHAVRYVNERRVIAPFLHNIDVKINGKNFQLSAYMDSGNRLHDPETGLPVTIVSFSWLKKCLPPTDSQKIKNKDWTDLSLVGAHLIEVSTIGNVKEKILVFAPEAVAADGKQMQCMIGVTFEKFNDLVSYDALLSPDLFFKGEVK